MHSLIFFHLLEALIIMKTPPTFFQDINALQQYTLSLEQHNDHLQCTHCQQTGQFVSHGFVYKAHHHGKAQITGKRLFCSNRSGRSGCGRTYRLYLKQIIPSLYYNSLHLYAFLSSLLLCRTIEQAYFESTGATEPRNAYRWLNKLQAQLIEYRQRVNRKTTTSFVHTQSKRLSTLLSSIERLFLSNSHQPCDQYQMHHQIRFI